MAAKSVCVRQTNMLRLLEGKHEALSYSWPWRRGCKS